MEDFHNIDLHLLNEIIVGGPQGDRDVDVEKYKDTRTYVTSLEGYDVFQYNPNPLNEGIMSEFIWFTSEEAHEFWREKGITDLL